MKIKDILKKMGIIKKEKEPIISPLGEAIFSVVLKNLSNNFFIS